MKRLTPVRSLGRSWFFGVALATLLLPLAARSQVIINEVLANNDAIAPLELEPDYTPDYIELYNNSTTNIDLGAGNWILVGTRAKTNFLFKPGTIIEPDSYLLVFCDKETNIAGLHSLFTLSAQGETVTLGHTNFSTVIITNITGFPPFEMTNYVTNVVVSFARNDMVSFGLQLPNYSVGRVPDFTGPFTLTFPSPCGGTIPCQTNVAAPFTTLLSSNEVSLKINEWMALDTSSGGSVTNDDWFELYNPDTNIVRLSGLVLADKSRLAFVPFPGSVPAIVPLSFIAPLGYVQIFANDGNDPDEVGFSLSSTSGDEIYIFGEELSTNNVIDHVKFGSQTINGNPITGNNPVVYNLSRGRIPDGGEDQIILPSATPRDSNFGRIDEILITEVLTHTDPPLEDAIELFNPTATNVNIGGWWLSNEKSKPEKYRIPANTIVPAGRTVVFYEYQFGGPGAALPFTLNSAHGDECWIFKAKANGDLSGFRRGISFGPAQNGVSFGRHLASDENVEIVAMSELSLGTAVTAGDPPSYQGIFRTGAGASNPAPRVGPLVINEIHYHPPNLVVPGVSTNDNSLDEFIEILNASEDEVRLYDSRLFRADRAYSDLPDGSSLSKDQVYADGRTNTWRVRGGVDFDFPADNLVIPRQGFVLVVNFDPQTNLTQVAAFRARFPNLPLDARLFGPYKGKLGNGGATVELQRPDAPQGPQHPDFRFIPRIVVDLVKYADKTPWPESPDAMGDSLQRLSAYDFGSDPINWKGGVPTPGQFNTTSGIEAPTIKTHPKGKSVRLGGTTTFSVMARGAAPLLYQWQHNGVPMTDETNSTLQLVNVSMDAAGPYTVEVANAAGSLVSAPAQLVVTQSAPDNRVPTVAFTKPGANARLTSEALLITGTARDNVGVETVEYSLNAGSFLTATGSPSRSIWGSPAPLTLVPGTNLLQARSVDFAGNPSAILERKVVYVATEPVSLTIIGDGRVVGAADQQPLELGRNYLLTAIPGRGQVFSNWVVTTNLVLDFISNAARTPVMMRSNLALTANFVPNPFLAAKGVYNGLIHESNCVRHASSGNFLVSVTERGTYSASIQLGGKRYRASGSLDLDGAATNSVALSRTEFVSVKWLVALNGPGEVAGCVSASEWTANLRGDPVPVFPRTSPSLLAGRYTWVIPGTGGDPGLPQGAGAGTVVVSAANLLTFVGKLAEGTTVSQRVPVSAGGVWPLYASIYRGAGSILSWVTFDTNQLDSDFTGALCWNRPAQVSKYYPGGFTNDTRIIGSFFTPPPRNGHVLDLTTGVVSIQGGNLPEDFPDIAVSCTNNMIRHSSPHRIVWKFTATSGLFSGTFSPVGVATVWRFSGAVLQKPRSAAGYFLGTDQSGVIELRVSP